MATCLRCGAVRADGPFCPNCGAPLVPAATFFDEEEHPAPPEADSSDTAFADGLPWEAATAVIDDRAPEPVAAPEPDPEPVLPLAALVDGSGEPPRLKPRAIVAAAVAVVVVASIVGVVVNSQDPATVEPSPTPSVTATTAAPTTPATSPPATSEAPSVDPAAAAQVDSLVELLTHSKNARKDLTGAISAARACKDLPAAIATIEAVGKSRTDLLAALDVVAVDKIPDGETLVGLLRTALQRSLDADEAWEAWVRSEADTSCELGTKNPLHATATKVNGKVGPAKNAFVTMWAEQIVPVYGVDEFTRDQI